METKVEVKVEIPAKKNPVLQPERMMLVEHGRQDWIVNAEEGVAVEQIMEPAFWAHTALKMKPFDYIEVRAEDGAWIAELRVLGCDRNWARVHLCHHYQLTTTDVSLSQAAKHEVKWKGPHMQFCVIRLADQMTVKEKCETKESAALWLREHERVVL